MNCKQMKKPERIGPYLLIKPLGEGVHRHVWLASAGENGPRLALKLARPGETARRIRLMQEMDMAATFDHPNIVRIHECAESQGILWLAMGYVPGPHSGLTLANFRQLLLALVHVHANRTIHADLKMASLLLDEDGNLRLSDFASARREGQGPVAAQGTPHFMSPEQLRGQAIDARADLFSAGAVLYQILTGKHPFSGTALEVMTQIVDNTQPAPSDVAPGLGDNFDAVVRKALARNRDERYASAFEFLSEFDAACKRGVRVMATS